jgi:NADH-dependent peroxiredoxin subunit C
MKEQIAMIQIGQKIDDFIDDLEFEAYQNNEIKKVKFSDYEGKWLVLLFYPADFTFICPTELQEAAEYYDTFKNEGAEILNVSTDTVFVHKAWHENSRQLQRSLVPWLSIRPQSFAAISEHTWRISDCPCAAPSLLIPMEY